MWSYIYLSFQKLQLHTKWCRIAGMLPRYRLPGKASCAHLAGMRGLSRGDVTRHFSVSMSRERYRKIHNSGNLVYSTRASFLTEGRTTLSAGRGRSRWSKPIRMSCESSMRKTRVLVTEQWHPINHSAVGGRDNSRRLIKWHVSYRKQCKSREYYLFSHNVDSQGDLSSGTVIVPWVTVWGTEILLNWEPRGHLFDSRKCWDALFKM